MVLPPFGGVAGAEPPDPQPGKPGHFAWSNWIKACVKALDAKAAALDAKDAALDKTFKAGLANTGPLKFAGGWANAPEIVLGQTPNGAVWKVSVLPLESHNGQSWNPSILVAEQTKFQIRLFNNAMPTTYAETVTIQYHWLAMAL